MEPDRARRAIVDEYTPGAERYDARWSWFVDATNRETLLRLSLRSGDRLLDVGCGTGLLLSEAGRRHPDCRLAGVDPVPAMLAVARRRLPADVELCAGVAERLPYADASFDAVTSCNVLHHVADPLAAVREMARVLRPGGVLALTDWSADFLATRIRDWYLRVSSPAHVRVYGARDFRRLLLLASFGEVEVRRYRLSALWGAMTARAVKAS